MNLVITIDTEEDNWLPYSQDKYTTSNIDRIPQLQKIFDEYGVRPTYLVTYQMALHDKVVEILGGIYEQGRCELGAHCHPWNTPPNEEAPVIENSMLCNLPDKLQSKKVIEVHETLKSRFRIEPKSFRSGRWGYSEAVAQTLSDLNYVVDTSITAYTDWSSCLGPDFSKIPPIPFRFSPGSIFETSIDGSLMQIPATVGFLQKDFKKASRVFNMIKNTPLQKLRLLGILDRLGMNNKIQLSPENSTAEQMISLAKNMKDIGYPVLNMFFHSSTLTAGLTPFVQNSHDEIDFLDRIRLFLDYAIKNGIQPLTLSETAKKFTTD